MEFTKQHLNGFNVQGYGQDRTWKMQCERLDASFWSCLRTARRLAAQTVRGSQCGARCHPSQAEPAAAHRAMILFLTPPCSAASASAAVVHSVTAAATRRFEPLRAPRAHTNAPYNTDLR
jgi:hypothetical protein